MSEIDNLCVWRKYMRLLMRPQIKAYIGVTIRCVDAYVEYMRMAHPLCARLIINMCITHLFAVSSVCLPKPWRRQMIKIASSNKACQVEGEHGLASMREVLLAEIRNGKRIQI